jgi:hypothetical protein
MANETLNPDQIREIMSKSRTKGAGEIVLQDFLDRGNPGEVVDLNDGILAGKSADSAAATLNNAKNKTTKDGENISLVNPQFQRILVKKVGKGDEAIVALINTESGEVPAAAAEG